MQGCNQSERYINGKCAAVGQFCPSCFVIGLYDGPVLCEREFKAHIRIGMTVGDVMNELAHCPAPRAIGGIKLRIVEAADCAFQLLGQLSKGLYLSGARGGVVAGGRIEAADGITKVV